MEDVDIAKELAEGLTEVPEPFKHDAFRILLKYRLGMQSLPTQVSHATEARAPSDVHLGFPEFYRDLAPEPKTNPQRFAAVAFFFREHLSQRSVSHTDITDAMRSAGLPPAKNFSRDIRAASDKRNALLIPAGDNKDGAAAWQLSKTGEDFLRGLLQNRTR